MLSITKNTSLSVIILSVIMLSVIMLNVITLSFIMLSVVMLSVIELSVVAPLTVPKNVSLAREFWLRKTDYLILL
jgi:hypothetical protein